MELRGYQRDAVAPALRGRNCIVWLPTGAGKTRAAVHVCRRHLESRRGGRVAVLVNKVHLVEQHAKKEFHVLQDAFRVTAVSGDSSHKVFFASVVKQSDVVICTAQILQNALVSTEEDARLELTGACWILRPAATALPSTTKSCRNCRRSWGAVQHILQLCANLDTDTITSAQEEEQQVQSHVPEPRKQYDLCQERVQDPFGERLKEVMERIQQYMEIPSLPQDFGTQVYEQRIVELESKAAEMLCRRTRVCALHLRKYNDALLINDTVRMVDAFQCLQQFYDTRKDTKDPTEQFLSATFEENRATLQALAGDQRYQNPRLDKLEAILREHFQPLGASRGIVFTKTRQSARSLLGWLQDTATLCGPHIRAAVLTGAGYSNQTRPMTQNEQQDVIKLFRNGTLNLLFSTSVAEEGLDIPECNIVVRYGLMTNEIAMMQAQGRARAENSVYFVLAKANSREVSRELLNEELVELMERAIRAVQAMPEQEYRLKIRELQQAAIATCLMKEARISERQQQHHPDTVRLHCVNCGVVVCCGGDIRTVEGMHHVNVNPSFGLHYRVSSGKIQFQRAFKDWEPGCRIACGECSQDWGMEMLYRQVKLPILCIKNFVVETPAEKRRYKKWSAVTFPIKEFDYVEYCSNTYGQSF
uniref:RNA helicase n=1 Tax=Amazona collaria TaxID=241587 RepID=A0A8B9FC89_9PSIT